MSAWPPRVVFVNRYFHPDVSATSQILFDLARRLVENGIEVHVVCSRQLYEDPAARLPANERIEGVHVHRIWTSRFGRGRLAGRALDYASFYVTSALRLSRLVRRDDVIVAKTDPPLISIVAAIVASGRRAHLINWLQDVFPEAAACLGANPLPGWLAAVLKKLRDQTLTMAAANVVLGGRMREMLERRRIPAERIRIIENWADGDAIVPMEVAASALRRSLGLTDELVVAYSGNLGRAHEFETILEAAEQLRSNRAVVFVMIGGGAKMQLLGAEVARRSLPNFRFLPYQPRAALADSLAAADVHLACLLPMLEGLIVPSKFYGILAAGRPAIFIGDEDGELARAIREWQCGAVVRTGDAVALVRVLVQLGNEPALRRAMGARGRSLFVEKYTVARAAEQWLRVLGPIGVKPRERDAVVDACP